MRHFYKPTVPLKPHFRVLTSGAAVETLCALEATKLSPQQELETKENPRLSSPPESRGVTVLIPDCLGHQEGQAGTGMESPGGLCSRPAHSGVWLAGCYRAASAMEIILWGFRRAWPHVLGSMARQCQVLEQKLSFHSCV